ncbi:MAG: hypothetical protein WA364_23995 [Candidatus Nitrosopolaris sp.]
MAGANALPCCETVFGSKPYIHEYSNIHDETKSVMSRLQVGQARGIKIGVHPFHVSLKISLSQ